MTAWKNKYGHDCDSIREEEETGNPYCRKHGHQEHTADKATGVLLNDGCCVCGGGSTTPDPTGRSVSKRDYQCEDLDWKGGWSDISCKELEEMVSNQKYEHKDSCSDKYLNIFKDSRNGVNMQTACCVCGGGVITPSRLSMPPRAPPPLPPTSSPTTADMCHDIGGPFTGRYLGTYSDCDSVRRSGGRFCEFHGDMLKNEKDITVNDACCVCGGGAASAAAAMLMDAYDATAGSGELKLHGAEFTTPPVVNIGTNALPAWNLDGSWNRGYTTVTSGSFTEGAAYTHAYWIQWRESNYGWRTLLRHSRDHATIVKKHDTELGMYSNRDGAFRGTGYHITPGAFVLLVVVGEGESATSPKGVSTFYVDGEMVGTADRVVCGTTSKQIGWNGQGPGNLHRIAVWDRALRLDEITALVKPAFSTASPTPPTPRPTPSPTHVFNEHEQWDYNPSTHLISNVNGICVDASHRNNVGGRVHMWTCNSNNLNQQWSYNSVTGQIKNMHGICLDANDDGRNGDGKVAHMWTCNSNYVNQQWDIYEVTANWSVIRNRQSSKCLHARSYNGRGSDIYLVDCDVTLVGTRLLHTPPPTPRPTPWPTSWPTPPPTSATRRRSRGW